MGDLININFESLRMEKQKLGGNVIFIVPIQNIHTQNHMESILG